MKKKRKSSYSYSNTEGEWESISVGSLQTGETDHSGFIETDTQCTPVRTKKRVSAAVIALVLFAALVTVGGIAALFLLRGGSAASAAVRETPAADGETGLPEAESVSEQAADAAATLEVHFIDVGQADCELLICGGQTMLIDGGNYGDADAVLAYLASVGVTRLDYVICTHPHEDHAGGLADIVRALPVGQALVTVSPESSTNSSYTYFIEALREKGIEPQVAAAGWPQFMLGTAECLVMGPVVSADDPYDESRDDPNDMSLMLRVGFGGYSFLFTGDAVGHSGENDEYTTDSGFEENSDDSEEEKTVIAFWSETDPGLLDIDVLKVAHHGSSYSTCSEFLYYTTPEYAVISVGADNKYGHPGEDTLDRLANGIFCNAEIFRTDEQGTIVCTVDDDGLHFSALGKSAS